MDDRRSMINQSPFQMSTEQEAPILPIGQIRQEYKKVYNNWLMMHYKISVWLVALSLIIELLIGAFLIFSNLLTISSALYILKYFIAPACANLTLISVATIALRSQRLSQSTKIYVISLVFLGICSVLATIHSIFFATYYLPTIAVALTAIYANYRVTGTTAALGFAAMIASELLIRWDPQKISILNDASHMINFLVALLIFSASALVSIVQIRYEIDKNESSVQNELERQLLHWRLRTDELTGVFSSRALHDVLREMDANPSENRYILAVVDLDKFKGINDRLGHHKGDSYLVAFANILKDNGAGADVYRYGGDEFCLLFKDVSINVTVETCRELRKRLSALTFEEYPKLRLTASFGLAAYTKNMTAARLFINADEAMYKAKSQKGGICIFKSLGQFDVPRDD